MNIETVNELIASLESAGELSIREQKFLKLAKAFQQLAAENVALKAVFIQGEIPSEAVDAFMETAVMDHDWNETSEWSWVENETEVIHAVLSALKPETPATDRIVAEAEASGVEKFAAEQRGVAERLQKRNVAVAERSISFCLDSAEEAEVFAKQLREGAK
ncbi:TPA: hypothetical protein MDB44_000798 [Klebsiella pneumoniae]|uniref:hypothetical protein n=1 Tax=Klebsiella pneumoniae TaxID=573 RepID=UPI001F4DDCC7|nr:hypothetical protein [Klebsiella pneumoniae]MCH9350505.1 hypothetical protein [Klebsiella pneumoniae]MCH9440718.1 hypothetical protein [Klebsiella pneumoniae]MCH9467024.1 hypothetical protein [Klebsiella pneumoniae]MCH9472318.1 hypothetical protein [Klebsiella pneumoniae]MCH9478401.1 hypothetical protein [Klebsiella pneumoniae]